MERDIEKAETELVAPIVRTPMKGGSLHFHIEYGKLRAVTVHDSYLFPRIDECIDSLGDALKFSTFDANLSQNQVSIDDTDLKIQSPLGIVGCSDFQECYLD